MRKVLLTAIRLYQRFVSPHKGFRCAYRVHTGRASCSTLGHRAVRRHGAIGGLRVLSARTRRCGEIHRAHRRDESMASPLLQRGFCDCDCPLPCDLLDCGSACIEIGGCDWPSRRPAMPEPAKPERALHGGPTRNGPDPGHSTWPGE